MSDLEKEELCCRTKGMTREEQTITARLLPDDVLWDELRRRYMTQNEMIKAVKTAVKEE